MRLAVAALLGPLLAGVTACTEVVECTLIGGSNEVSVSVPKGLFVRSGSLAVEMCDDDGCASTTRRVGPARQPSARTLWVSLDQLGRSFDPGTVEARVELRDPAGELVASTVEDTVLERYFPNGEECDGDGYVSGTVDLQVEDAGGPPVVRSSDEAPLG
jgi:hypothetical protein